MSLESGNIKEKLNSAIEKLFTLKPLKKKSLKTSRHDFGIEEEEKDTIIYDRCTFEIEIKRNTFITCQIIFDSRNYTFPPDILFHELPEQVKSTIDDLSLLLPDKEWDLHSENCLYVWFDRILKLIVEEEPAEEIQDKQDTKKPIKKSWALFKDNDDEAKNKKLGIFSDDDDFEPVTAPKKSSVINNMKGKEKERPRVRKSSLPDIEFVDDDYNEYKSTHEVIDTTEDMDDLEIVDTTLTENEDEDILDITEDSKKKEEEKKPMGRYKANMAAIKKKHKSSIDIDDKEEKEIDNSVFDFPSPTSFNAIASSKRALSSPKRQTVLSSMFTSPKRPSPSPSSSSSTNHKKRKSIVDLMIDDTDDFEPIVPPVKLRKTTESPKIFDLSSNSSKHPRLTTASIFNMKFKKKFVTLWLSRYKNHIINYDADKFEYFTLGLTLEIPTNTSLWQKYRQEYQVQVEGLDTKNLIKPKPHAPIIVHFKLDRHFPTTNLEMEIFSVVNTDKLKSNNPESMKIEFNVDRTIEPSKTIDAIIYLLEERAPSFHLQLPEEDEL